MKQLLIFVFTVGILASCLINKQASNVTGRTDDVYFTVNDTRKKVEAPTSSTTRSSESSLQNQQSNTVNRDPDGYTGSYANRMRYFRSGRYFYDAYRPSIVPSLYYNYYSGWNIGLTYTTV